MKRSYSIPALLAALATPAPATAQIVPAAPVEQCTAVRAGTAPANEWLARAAARVLPPSIQGRVLRYLATQDRPEWGASDRAYEPFTPNMWTETHWLDLTTKMEGVEPPDRHLAPGQPPTQIYGLDSSAIMRDTTMYIIPGAPAWQSPFTRMNAWTVLLDWRAHGGDARLVERCTYRDYPRVVLARGGERLYLSESDATPVKLERVEPHFIWGQVKAEYVWTSWGAVAGGGIFPNAVFRVLDGVTYERLRAYGQASTISVDSAPPLRIRPGSLDISRDPLQARFNSTVIDTLRVAEHTFLLTGSRFSEAVTLARDTVFLLDATLSEDRARGDSAWIAALYPGRHPMVVVLSDIAWFHLAGVRFWVARGATIVANRQSEPFLRRVVGRRWTLAPDALEKARRAAALHLRAVDDSLVLAGGDLVVHALQGSSAELALGTWVRPAQLFWAGDYVQGASGTAATRDVVATIRRLGIRPARVASQRTKLTTWDVLDQRYPPAPPP